MMKQANWLCVRILPKMRSKIHTNHLNSKARLICCTKMLSRRSLIKFADRQNNNSAEALSPRQISDRRKSWSRFLSNSAEVVIKRSSRKEKGEYLCCRHSLKSSVATSMSICSFWPCCSYALHVTALRSFNKKWVGLLGKIQRALAKLGWMSLRCRQSKSKPSKRRMIVNQQTEA